MPRCKVCQTPTTQRFGLTYACGFDHAIEYAQRNVRKKQQAAQRKAEREEKRKHREQKEKVKTRTEWYDQLQALVNQYVVKVRDANEWCCTCGTRNNVKYDAGHCFTRKARPELRFELTNIHKQCSVQCNQHGSGMRAEYFELIKLKYGDDHFEWLNGPHPSLKNQYPEISDIKADIVRYRKLLRDNGVTPAT